MCEMKIRINHMGVDELDVKIIRISVIILYARNVIKNVAKFNLRTLRLWFRTLVFLFSSLYICFVPFL